MGRVPVEEGDPASETVWAAPIPEWNQPVELVADILWVRTRLPFALDHINLWLLDDGDGWTAIDTGYGDERTWALWGGLLAGVLARKPLHRVLVTHHHPDHLGSAGWLCRRTGAPLLMSRVEWLTGRMLQLDTSPEFVAAGEAYDRRAGLDQTAVAARRQRGNAYRPGVTAVPAQVELLEAGQVIRLGGSDWRVIIGRGHAPAQVTLYSAERGLLLAADQILPRITPVVGIWPSTADPDPLGDFQASLALYEDLPADTLVLPGHERPYRGLGPRITGLRQHHQERLERALSLVRAQVTTAQVMRGLFTRELDSHQIGFALAEALAHLRALQRQGLVGSILDDMGVERFTRI